MIITSLHAKNFLKYESVELADLPEEGIIAVSGVNESGKSTIGEILCFALFGRTFSLDDDHIEKSIRWGEAHCSVTVHFFQGKERYALFRFLDKNGNHGAKLSSNENGLIANGQQPVLRAIEDMLGYGFEGFIHSFYLAQREITAPHPKSEIVKLVSGISKLKQVEKEIDLEIEKEKGEIDIARSKISEVQSEIDELLADKLKLRALRKKYTTHNDLLGELHRGLNGLEQAYTHYQNSLPIIQKIQKTWLRIKGIRDFFWIITLLVSVLVLVFNWLPNFPWKPVVASVLEVIDPTFYFLSIPVIITLVFLFFQVRRVFLKKRLQILHRERIEFAKILRRTHYATTLQRSLEIRREETTDSEEILTDQEIEQVTKKLTENKISETRTCDVFSRVSKRIEYLIQQHKNVVEDLNENISKEELKVKKIKTLEEIRAGFQATEEGFHRKVTIRQLATELVQGTCNRMEQHFNRAIRDLASVTLPLFTENRYEYLRIDTHFRIEIFSKEKNDFMDLEELSSGTQRQTMLALRLAIAQRLVDRTGGVPQFVFLDEPFAFFDESRTKQTLSVLPKIGGMVKQIWIVAQSFPNDLPFRRRLHCTPDQLVLSDSAKLPLA